jgi:hypothetical protein
MPMVWMMLGTSSFPTTEEQIDTAIMEASKYLPKQWLDGGLPVWEDPLHWMIHPPGEIFQTDDGRDQQVEMAAELQRRMPDRVPVIVTLTDDPQMEYVVGRLRIVNHDEETPRPS